MGDCWYVNVRAVRTHVRACVLTATVIKMDKRDSALCNHPVPFVRRHHQRTLQGCIVTGGPRALHGFVRGTNGVRDGRIPCKLAAVRSLTQP